MLLLFFLLYVYFLLTLRWLDSIAFSRSRRRLCFSAWGRGMECGRAEEEGGGLGGLLEHSLTAPLAASLGTRHALHILNDSELSYG